MLAYLTYPALLRPEILIGFPFRWYGVMYILAFATSYLLFLYQARIKWKIVDTNLVTSFFFWDIVGLLVGARLFGTLVYDPTGYYLAKPWMIIWPFDESMRFIAFQGMSYHGGILGLIIAFSWFAKKRKIDFLEWGDMLAAAIPRGYTFGRIGNFLNAELYGRATTSSLGMIFPNAEGLPISDPRIAAMAKLLGILPGTTSGLVNLPRYPSQLFEALFEGLLLWIVLWPVLRKRSRIKGTLIGAYIAMYGFFRFFLEYFRESDIGIGFPLALGDPTGPRYLLTSLTNFTMGQILCAAMVVAGIVFIILGRHYNRDSSPGMPGLKES